MEARRSITMDSLLAECAQHLRGSTHDYEKLLGSSVASVWRTVSAVVERQLRLHKSVGVPSLGRFAFVKDVQPPTPVFLLADRFVSSYSAVWRRPPPALVTPVTEVNMSVIGSEAGGLPRDQAAKTLDAIVAFIGGRIQKGTASGSLRVGAVGVLSVDGKTIAFAFDAAFVKSLARSGSAAKKALVAWSIAAAVEPVASLPRAISLQALAPVERLNLPPHEATDSHKHKEKAHSSSKHHTHHRDRHSNSASDLAIGVADALAPPPPSHATSKQQQLQILPRFMLPDPRKAAATRQVYDQQVASLQRAFEFKRGELQLDHQQHTREEREIAKRTDASRLRCVQEQAQKSVDQRELDAFLHSQIQAKRQREAIADGLHRKPAEYDSVKILPRDPIVTEEQRHQAKLQLRRRLHDQVTLKDSLAKHSKAVDRAESAYFMEKVHAQAEREERERLEYQRIAREALTRGWQQQQEIHQQCRLTQGRPGR